MPDAPTSPPPPAPATTPLPQWSPGRPPWQSMVRPELWSFVSFISRAVGFVLIFAGTLAIVAGVSIPGSCLTTPASCSGFLGNAANWLIVGKILAVLGLGALGLGAALKLHYVLRAPSEDRPSEAQVVAAERRSTGLLFVITVLLLFVLILTVNSGLSGIPGFP